MQDTDLIQHINSQKNKIQSGSPKIEIIAPCVLNDGIIAIGDIEKSELITIFEQEEKKLLFFVPASGSGSRMFDFLLSTAPDEVFEKDQSILQFLNNLECFAFYDEELRLMHSKWKDGEMSSRKLIELIIGASGKDFSSSPKGLIPFHLTEEGPLNAFQEHILQGLLLEAHKTQFHFTIQESFKSNFLSCLDELGKKFENDYYVDFSIQNPSTDSYAFDESLNTIELQNGHLLRRPAGHGALLENLIDLNNQIVLIKNIDNVQHLNSSEKSIEIWKTLCGLLLKVKNQLQQLYEKPSLEGLLEFNQRYQLYTSEQLNLDDDTGQIKKLINRPLRISGMVHNEGKAGGGPFFVKTPNGDVSKQIIEAVQVSNDESQQKLLSQSTHFNPVMLVLDLYDFEGNKHDLKSFRNDDNYFVVNKMYQGKNISFIELPGLWNGAMYDWNTLFVEIPIDTFTPVKTVLDLLDSNHQPKK